LNLDAVKAWICEFAPFSRVRSRTGNVQHIPCPQRAPTVSDPLALGVSLRSKTMKDSGPERESCGSGVGHELVGRRFGSGRGRDVGGGALGRRNARRQERLRTGGLRWEFGLRRGTEDELLVGEGLIQWSRVCRRRGRVGTKEGWVSL